jgi:8-oxo-dGTP pyrophosphatase MutT (NUDIX family)
MMSVDELVPLLANRLRKPLPGAVAHEPLRATPTGLIKPDFRHSQPPRPGSVLILLCEGGSRVHIPLIKRPDYFGAHSGQVSFPGGKAEPDETSIDTALREAEEEIGVPAKAVEVLGTLSPFFVIPSNFLVTPVVGVLTRPQLFVPNAKEVARILQAHLENVLPDEAIQTRDILAARMYPMRAPHFSVEGEIVWGATAMMLNEFRMIVKELLEGS